MEFRVLGTIEVAGPSPSASPPGAKERAILARLLIDPGRTVPAEALLEAAWEGAPRELAARSLAVRVANLRAFLEPGRNRGAPSSLLIRDGSGYRLETAPEEVDARRFERCVRTAAGLPAAAALDALDDALALWRGTPFGDFADAEFAREEVRRLEALRSQAEEARARALLELGRPLEAVDDLRRLTASDPLREELVRTLMLALYAAGRQVEALAAYRELAGRLRELGLAPGPATRTLERRILDNDATLAAPAALTSSEARAAAPAGRAPELARVRAALARALSGRRAGMLLSGEPGVGKSTLVDAFLHEAAPTGIAAGIGQCLAQRGPGEPYMPVLEALGALARGTAGDVVVGALALRAPTWLVELPWLLGDDDEAEAARQRAQGSTRTRMLREMLEALDAVCAATPVVLVLEDLHWADDSTLDLVAALLRRREPARMLLLGTYRPEGEPPVHELAHELGVRGLCEELPVGRLAPAAVAAHLEARFPSAPLPDGLAEVLARRSGGNPLFMRNLLDHWLADGTLAERSGAVALTRPRALEAGVPPTLHAHIRHQLARLQAEDAELLGAASVAGRAFSVETLAAALESDRDEVAARCAELARSTRLIERRDGGHAFQHDLHREVLYELLPPDARARLHARVGAHLADSYGPAAAGMAAELGFHFVAGRDPERAVRFLQLAAERAFGRNAHAEGIRHLRAALDAAAELEAGTGRTRSEVELLSSLGQALVATGGWSAAEAEDALLRARALAARLSDNEPLVSVLLALATLYELRGEYTRASAMAQECEQLAPGGSAAHALESSELIACSLFHQGSFARALEYAERGVALFESGGAPGSYTTFPATLGDNAGVSCHDWAGLALWFLGKPDSALARATHALELARDRSRAYSLATARAQMAVVHQCRREPEAAYEWAEATIAAAQRLGYVYREAMGRVLRGWALALLGEAPEGAREISEGLAASRGTGARMDDPHYLALLAEAQLRAGELEAGLAAVAAALELAGRERSLFYEPELHRLAGALHAAAGRADVADACLQRGLARAREQDSRALELRVATDLARLPGDRGRAAAARSAVAAVYARFEEGLDTRDLRDAAAVLAAGGQAIVPVAASASTSMPSVTR
ncbi:MAG TPA: BTAD domain-containing putative transcriptional regulator [Solirubrobacteraceae bacterium]|nr:BTAD domain-containing putative transcriptional regulator [Solirubrobacteraceae bacterium]